MRKISTRSWRIANALLFAAGLLAPWTRVIIDAYDVWGHGPPTIIFFWGVWMEAWGDLQMWPLWLFNFCTLLLLVYFLLNLYRIGRNTAHRRNQPLAMALFAITTGFAMIWLIMAQPLVGYWLINLALISSAILECGPGGRPDQEAAAFLQPNTVNSSLAILFTLLALPVVTWFQPTSKITAWVGLGFPAAILKSEAIGGPTPTCWHYWICVPGNIQEFFPLGLIIDLVVWYLVACLAILGYRAIRQWLT